MYTFPSTTVIIIIIEYNYVGHTSFVVAWSILMYTSIIKQGLIQTCSWVWDTHILWVCTFMNELGPYVLQFIFLIGDNMVADGHCCG